MSDWQAGNISMLVSIMYVLTLVASLRACNSSLLPAIMLYGRLAIFPWWTQCGVKVVYFTWFSPEQLQGQRSCLGEYHCCRIAHFHWAEQSFHSRCFGLSSLQCWISVSHATKPCAQPCWRPSWNGADLYLAEGVFLIRVWLLKNCSTALLLAHSSENSSFVICVRWFCITFSITLLRCLIKFIVTW